MLKLYRTNRGLSPARSPSLEQPAAEHPKFGLESRCANFRFESAAGSGQQQSLANDCYRVVDEVNSKPLFFGSVGAIAVIQVRGSRGRHFPAIYAQIFDRLKGMTERELLREQWQTVSRVLQIEFVGPFILPHQTRQHEFAYLLPQFGGGRGVLIDSRYVRYAYWPRPVVS